MNTPLPFPYLDCESSLRIEAVESREKKEGRITCKHPFLALDSGREIFVLGISSSSFCLVKDDNPNPQASDLFEFWNGRFFLGTEAPGSNPQA
jgi:hypothetical protein